jgi:YgiT-type zinc finger domain-containing protein
MKCSIQGCPGQYESRLIVHTVRKGEEVFVFENVPVDVCNICSDTILAPETVRHLENLMRRKTKPERFAPVYAYA